MGILLTLSERRAIGIKSSYDSRWSMLGCKPSREFAISIRFGRTCPPPISSGTCGEELWKGGLSESVDEMVDHGFQVYYDIKVPLFQRMQD
jgi:hypothetical protein